MAAGRVLKAALAAALIALGVAQSGHAKDLTNIVITEPINNLAYLPVLAAVTKGYFADEGLSAKVINMNNSTAHVNAVLSGDAFAYIGGPEHNAYAEVKGAQLRAIINVVDRGNVYLTARQGVPQGTDLGAFLRGRKIGVVFYGGTPNSILRYLLVKWGLDPKRDVTLVETSNPGVLAAAAAGQIDIGVITDPLLTQGMRNGTWQAPFYNVPKELGPYAYSTLNVKLDTIRKSPELVAAVVKAIRRALQFVYADPAGATAVAQTWFPTMPADDMKATMDRAYQDEQWSRDGMVTPESWNTAEAVVRAAGILTEDVPYDAAIDMSFVKRDMAQK
ncbi:MAG: ABC transporter substrate-binding protein [Alphaproteobacteria bacterium]|nr:ABC transporter substrate-binding protein [Alphaproteobacteria bacterium]